MIVKQAKKYMLWILNLSVLGMAAAKKLDCYNLFSWSKHSPKFNLAVPLGVFIEHSAVYLEQHTTNEHIIMAAIQ